MQHRYAKCAGIALFVMIAFLPGLCPGGILGPGNYWECILDDLPGTETNTAANDILQECEKKFPERPSLTTPKTGFLGIGAMTIEECISKYSKKTESKRALNAIQRACNKVYPLKK